MLDKDNSFAAADVAELLEEALRFRTIESLVASAPSPHAMLRRVYDITHGRTQRVTHRVTDEIVTMCGRPDWLQVLES